MYTVKRSEHNPILAPSGTRPWEAQGTFNGCAVRHGKEIHLLYRALGNPDALMAPSGISTIGSAISIDGAHFPGRRQLITPQEPWEQYGCEDPRVTFFEGRYYIFYTALGGIPFGAHNIKVACAVSKDLENIEERHLVTPFNAKAMALFPERVGGKITAILTVHTDEPPAHIALVQCDRLEELWDEKFWQEWHAHLPEHIINPLRFQEDHIEVGAPPVKTKDGWLLVYSYIQNYFGGGGPRVFGIESLLFDLKDPHTIVGQTKGPMMVPEETYERYGAVPNIIFPTGAILEQNGRLDIYYGAADMVCAKASLNLPDLLGAIIPSRRKELATRVPGNPVITPDPSHEWESVATFNPAAIDLDGTVHILYRALSPRHISTLGYATSKSGSKISERLPEPVYVPREDFEMQQGGEGMNSGCEDPRISQIGSTLYLSYTAFNGKDPWHAALSTISVKDFLARKWNKWSKPVLVTPDNIKDKDFCLLPAKVNDKYMLIHRVDSSGEICADFFDMDDFGTRRINRCIELMGPRPGMWDSVKVGVGGAPIKTPLGWLLFYHGISKTSTYRMGVALLDLKNPTTVIARSVDAILEPTEPYELEGIVNKVVFSCGAVVRGDTIFLYYGGADRVVGIAKLSLKRLLKILCPPTLA